MKTEQTLAEKVAAKASKYIDHFEKIAADRDGHKEEVYILKNNAPSELRNLVREVHGDFLPDDFRYETILDALYALAECSEDLDNAILEADIYHCELLKWLGSDLRRIAYCDEAKSEFDLQDVDLMTLISYGQQREKDEILDSVRQLLIEICEEEEFEESA